MKTPKGLQWVLGLVLPALVILFPGPACWATVDVETDRSDYNCNGTQTTYTYAFRVFEDDDLRVLVSQASEQGEYETLTLNVDYTVTGAGDATGTVVLADASSCGDDEVLSLLSRIDILQQTDYVDGQIFSAESVETALDRTTRIVQQINEKVNRSAKFEPQHYQFGSPGLPAPSDGAWIRWNGYDFENFTPDESLVDTAAIQSWVEGCGDGTAERVKGSYYPSTSGAITDHGDASTVGSIAYVLAATAQDGSTAVHLCPNTTYTITTALTIRATVTFVFEAGAVLGGAATLTWTAPGAGIVAGLTQIFDTTLTHSGSPGVSELYPEWFGATGDGGTNDLPAFNEMSTMAENGTAKKMKLTAGRNYLLADTWQFTDIGDDLIIEAWGAKITSQSTTEAVLLGEVSDDRIQRTKWFGGTITKDGGADYTTESYGLRVLNGSWLQIEPEFIFGFKYGLALTSSIGEGTSYCWVNPGSIVNNLHGIVLRSDGAGSFTNENWFFGGRVGHNASAPDCTGGYSINIGLVNGGTVPNGNKFYGTALESSKSPDSPEAPVYNNGERGLFDTFRFEGSWVSSYRFIEGPDVSDPGTGASKNVYRGGTAFRAITEVDLDDDDPNRVRIDAEQSMYRSGGDGTSPLFTLRELNSNTNRAVEIQNTQGTVVFTVGSDGQTVISPVALAASTEAFTIKNPGGDTIFKVLENGRFAYGTTQDVLVTDLWYAVVTPQFATVSANTAKAVAVTVTGAESQNTVVTATPNGSPGAGLGWCAYVTAADEVTIRLINPTVAPIVTSDQTWYVRVEALIEP